MEPKFQSSFIPKGPLATSGMAAAETGHKSTGLIGIIVTFLFTATVILCVGVFGYNFYLGYHIANTGEELEAARAQVDTDVVNELIRSNARMNATSILLGQHVVVSPVFDFLETETLKSVRFVDMSYANTDNGVGLSLKGNARGYSAVALQAQAFIDSSHFRDVAVSDLSLDESGDVVFTLTAIVDPQLISYSRAVERYDVPVLNNQSVEEEDALDDLGDLDAVINELESTDL